MSAGAGASISTAHEARDCAPLANRGDRPANDGWSRIQIAAALVQAITIGSTADKRPLLVSLHARADDRVMAARPSSFMRSRLADVRVVVKLVAAPSLEAVVPVVAPPSVGYVVYTRDSPREAF